MYYLLSIKIINNEIIRKSVLCLSKFFKISHVFVTKKGQGKIYDLTSENLIYEGTFSNNVREGFGKYYTQHTGLVYVGNWKDDEKNGYGEHTEILGNICYIYRGHFVKGKKEGYGEYLQKGTWDFKLKELVNYPKEICIYRGYLFLTKIY